MTERNEEFDAYIDELYPLVSVLGYEYSASYAFRMIDPIAYLCEVSNYEDMIERNSRDEDEDE